MLLRLFSVAAAAAVLTATAVAAEPPSVDEFLDDPNIRDLALSPSGDRLAVVVAKGESRALAIYDTADFASPPIVHPFSELAPLWVEWANEERVMVALFNPTFEFTRTRLILPSARIVAMNVDGTQTAVLFSDESQVMRDNYNLANITDVLPNDPGHVIMPGVRGRDLDLWKVDVYSGEADRIGVGTRGTIAWLTNIDGRPAARFDANSRGSIIKVFAPESSEPDARWRKVATVHERDRPKFNPVAYSEQPGVLYVAARPDGEDRAAIYRYDTEKNQLLEKVAGHPDYDVHTALVDGRSGKFRGFAFVDDRIEYRWTDPDIQANYEAIDDYFGESVNLSVFDSSQDGRTWLLFARGPTNPGSYHVYDLDAAKLDDIGLVSAKLTESRLGAMEPVTYAARDGAQIRGYVTRPPGLRPPPYPTVVMPHGGPELRDVFDFDVMTQFLATRGYLVFQPNFRGSAGFGEDYLNAGRKEWGARMQDDITDGLQHLVDSGLADPAKVCIVGGSYGGYAALAGATLTPDRYQCAASINGVSDLPDFLRAVRRDRDRDDDEYDYWVRVIGDPKTDAAALEAHSPARRAADATASILLIHGSHDGVVPYDQSEDMEKALKKAGKDVAFVTLSGAGHSGFNKAHTRRVFEELESFLGEHLPLN